MLERLTPEEFLKKLFECKDAEIVDDPSFNGLILKLRDASGNEEIFYGPHPWSYHSEETRGFYEKVRRITDAMEHDRARAISLPLNEETTT